MRFYLVLEDEGVKRMKSEKKEKEEEENEEEEDLKKEKEKNHVRNQVRE